MSGCTSVRGKLLIRQAVFNVVLKTHKGKKKLFNNMSRAREEQQPLSLSEGNS